MNIVDIVVISLVALAGLVNLIAGFHKGSLNNIFTIAKIALLIVLSPIVVGMLKKIDMVKGVLDSLATALEGIKSFSQDLPAMAGFFETLPTLVGDIVCYVIAVIALFIVLSIVFALLKFIAKKIAHAGSAMRAIDRVLGLIFGIAFWAAAAAEES